MSSIQDPIASLTDSATLLESNQPKDWRVVRERLKQLAAHQISTSVKNQLKCMAASSKPSHQVIGYYTILQIQLAKEGSITTPSQMKTDPKVVDRLFKSLFPFSVADVADVVCQPYAPKYVESDHKEIVATSAKKEREMTKRFAEAEHKHHASAVTVTKQEPKDDQPAAYVVTMPLVLSNSSEKNDKKIKKIVDKLQTQGFHRTSEASCWESADRLRIVIGGNRFRSIVGEENRGIKQYLSSFVSPVGTCLSFFGFFWEPRWVRNEDAKSFVPLEDVRRYCLYLTKLDPECAEAIHKHIRSVECARMRDRVPYQEIRETIKDHEMTKAAIQELRNNYKERRVYLAVMDPDFRKLRSHHQGLFSHYDCLIEEHYKKKGCYPAVASTGYKASPDTPPVLRCRIEIDQRVRAVVGKIFADTPYLPEPNLIIAVQPQKRTVVESFINSKTIKQESRNIVNAILKRRRLVPENAIAFQTRGAIETTIPRRFFTKLNSKRTDLNSCTVGQKQFLKALRGQDQSSHHPRNGWAINIANSLYSDYDISARPTLISQLAKVWNQFDPITLAQTQQIGVYSDQQNFVPMLESYETQSLILWKGIVRIARQDKKETTQEFIAFCQQENPRETRSQSVIKDFIQDTFNQVTEGIELEEIEDFPEICQSRLTILAVAYGQLRGGGLSLNHCIRIVKAAKRGGFEIFSVLHRIYHAD